MGMNNFVYFSLIALIIIPITNYALADVFVIQIPTDASKIDSSSHFIPQEITVLTCLEECSTFGLLKTKTNKILTINAS